MSHKKRLCERKSRKNVKNKHNYHSYKAYLKGKKREQMKKEGRKNARKHK